jgi:hypothetical protein
MTRLRTIAALGMGCATALAIAAVLFSLLRAIWPAYVAAEPDRAYSLGMLFARLSIAAVIMIGAGCAATLVARDDGRTAWWLGALFLLLSLPSHLYTVWDEYPAWYHAVYLLALIPVTGYGGTRFAARKPT